MPYKNFKVESNLPDDECEVKINVPTFYHRNRRIITGTLLFFANLLNYIDRFVINGILPQIQDYFGFNDKATSLLTTIFLVFYMLFSLIFGFIGDHVSRKKLIIAGIFVWSLFTLLGSFVPYNLPILFYISRGIVGIGESALSTLGVPFIGDLFEGKTRTRMLSLFFIGLPLGNGIGYVMGPLISNAFKTWKWNLRITPIIGFLLAILSIFIMYDPEIKEEEMTNNLANSTENIVDLDKKSFVDNFKSRLIIVVKDTKYLITKKSYILSTLGYVYTTFIIGIFSVWFPTTVILAGVVRYDDIASMNESAVGISFGLSLFFLGIFGVVAGGEICNYLRKRIEDIQPLICGILCIFATIPMYISIICFEYSLIGTWIGLEICVFCVFLTFTPTAGIIMAVVEKKHRGLASALQIFSIHSLGDAISPLVVGIISDYLRSGSSIYQRFRSLYLALYIAPFASVAAGIFYLVSSMYYVNETI